MKRVECLIQEQGKKQRCMLSSRRHPLTHGVSKVFMKDAFINCNNTVCDVDKPWCVCQFDLVHSEWEFFQD